MKKFLKWMGVAVLIPVLLIASLAALLYFPPFQQWAVKQAAAYVSEQTGREVSVGSVRLKFPLDLSLGDVRVDSIAHIRNMVADIQLLPLLKKQVVFNELTFEDAHINTADFIAAARVKGDIGKLRLTHSDILLKGRDDPSVSDVNLSDILLADSRLDVVLADSVPEDTTASETLWRIFAQKAKIQNTNIQLTMPAQEKDTPADVLTAHLGDATMLDGMFDLKNGQYHIGSLALEQGSLAYGDYDLHDIALKTGAVDYAETSSSLSANLQSLSLKEKGGLEVRKMSGLLTMNDERLKLKDVKIETSESTLTADWEMALDAFDMQTLQSADLVHSGTMKGTLHASLGKQDLMRFMESIPSGFQKKWPDTPLKIDGEVRGNMQNLNFSNLEVSLPTAFSLKASGTLRNLQALASSSQTSSASFMADVDFDARGEKLDFVNELLPADVRSDIRIPHGLTAQGHVKVNDQQYDATFKATTPVSRTSSQGLLAGVVKVNTSRMAYEAKLKANRFPLQQFLPSYGLSPITAHIDLKGQGTDLMSSRTLLTAKAVIRQFSYQGYSLAGMKVDSQVRNGHAYAVVNSDNAFMKGVARIDALMSTDRLRGTLVMDLGKADLQRLGWSDSMLIVSGCAHLDIDSDLKSYHKVQGSVGDLTLYMQGDTFRPDDMWIDALASPTQTRAVIHAGDFRLDLDAKEDYDHLLGAGSKLVEAVQKQYAERVIDPKRLRALLPDAQLSVASGSDNFVVKLLNRYGYQFGNLSCQVVSSPVNGLNGRLHLESLMIDSILVDTVRFSIRSDSVRTSYQAQICNNKKNPQYTFNALIDGILQDRGTIIGTRLYDDNGELGVRLGLQATMQDDGFMFRTYGKEPVLGYRVFQVNDSNYVYLGKENRVSADVVLKADDGTGVQIYSNDDNEEVKQDITISLHHFDLEKILAVIPYTPDISGLLNGDFHLVQTDNQLSISSDMTIRQMAYEKSLMGDMGAEFVYMPKSDGEHYVDGTLLRNGEEIATVSGTYYSEGPSEDSKHTGGYLDAQIDLVRLPLSLANGFFPDQILGLEGYGEGTVDVRGPLSKPDVDGEVYLDSAYLVSQPYGIRMRFDNDPVLIKDSKLLFENFNLYANNSSPLTTYGQLDFTDLDHMRLDMRMRAQNFLLIDSKENPRSEAYGKAYVNYFGTISGELSNLHSRGRLDVLGTTDLVYILRDSPLTTDNQLDELVKFTDFSDTTQTIVSRPELVGFSMDMTVDISKGAHLMAYMNADKTNYIDLMGGGTLRMNYNTADELRLTGRYTLANGEMKYSLPVIPLKTFTIQDGSYLEFTGDPMNPTLNITATEQVKVAVSGSNGVGRSVAFDCGVKITKTLNDMGLEFTLDAPEDMQLHSELQAMSKEQRGKLAVTMLTTGMYLADGNTNGFSMNNALSTFLQSEINNITGNALRTLDFSVGLDNSTDAAGNISTNYSFKFAKRFWNNRLKISLGGKVSTGAEVQNQNQSFFDNVMFEYRLDDTANKYVTLFYENNVYDWLDGYTQEYGVGFIWRRSLQHFKDIFDLRGENARKTTLPSTWRPSAPVVRDSLQTSPSVAPSDSVIVKQ